MSTPNKKRIALVLPAYNEGQVVRSVVADLTSAFSKAAYTYQIIVVDDCSSDNTSSEAASAGAYVIRHLINTGSGGATATGLRYCEEHDFDIAITCDADGQHAAEDVISGVRKLIEQDADLLIGSRLLQGGEMSRTKILGNAGLSIITNLLFGVRVTDSQSGLRVFSRRALAVLRWKSSGYEFCSEMLWRARQSGLLIGEFPIRSIYTEYSKAKGQNNWNAVNIIKSLLQRRIIELFE